MTDKGLIKDIEHHPLEPFLPEDSRLLLLGSFPPKKERWSMNFYYPNLQNDMWRIFGLIYFGDKDFFLNRDKKSFREDDLKKFLTEKHIAISDTAISVIRHKDNASDNFLEITEPRDIRKLLRQIPPCSAIATTGQKATETLSDTLGIDSPKIGEFTTFTFDERIIRFYRMPSSSRAYPLKLEKKAEVYKLMLDQIKLLE